jgi:serine/threonine-protein phosphatase 2A regulatory subunit B''
VDATDDINTVLNYFSYEHFYVLYCRFWELDEDRDMLISQQDLQKYSPDGTMNPQIVERVFQGHGRKLACKTRGKMNYEDFVWFCLCEEDKTTPKAIRFWFRVLDLDGDGVLCGYEMETFYGHTKKQLLQMTTEGISFADVLCQVSDMLPFPLKRGIRLGDLLAVPQAAHVTFNMIMNVIRFLQFEQRDPFVAHHERLLGGFERNDWDRFARQEYDRMAQEADGE